jgi:hypothetical protein
MRTQLLIIPACSLHDLGSEYQTPTHSGIAASVELASINLMHP